MFNTKIQFTPQNKKSNTHLLLGILGTLAIFLFYQIGGAITTEFFIGNENYTENSDTFIILQCISQILFMLIPTALISKFSALPAKELFRLKKFPKYSVVIYSLLGVVAIQILSIGWQSFQEYLIPATIKYEWESLKKIFDDIYSIFSDGSSIGVIARNLVAAAVIPALAEEFLFRGFLQRSLEERIKPANAILLTGVIFGFIHFNPTSVVPLIIFGVFLGLTAWAGGTIWLPALLHFINNAFAIYVLIIEKNEIISATEDYLPLLPAVLLLFGGGALVTLSAFFLIKETNINILQAK